MTAVETFPALQVLASFGSDRPSTLWARRFGLPDIGSGNGERRFTLGQAAVILAISDDGGSTEARRALRSRLISEVPPLADVAEPMRFIVVPVAGGSAVAVGHLTDALHILKSGAQVIDLCAVRAQLATVASVPAAGAAVGPALGGSAAARAEAHRPDPVPFAEWAEGLLQRLDRMHDVVLAPKSDPDGWGNRVSGRCPACGSSSLFVEVGGHITCARAGCPDPTAVADQLLANPSSGLLSRTTAPEAGPGQDGSRSVLAGPDQLEVPCTRRTIDIPDDGMCPDCGRTWFDHEPRDGRAA